jgi:hypothetical protein
LSAEIVGYRPPPSRLNLRVRYIVNSFATWKILEFFNSIGT